MSRTGIDLVRGLKIKLSFFDRFHSFNSLLVHVLDVQVLEKLNDTEQNKKTVYRNFCSTTFALQRPRFYR